MTGILRANKYQAARAPAKTPLGLQAKGEKLIPRALLILVHEAKGKLGRPVAKN